MSELEKQGEGVTDGNHARQVPMRAAPARAVSPAPPASPAVIASADRTTPSPFLPRLLGRPAPCEAKVESPLPQRREGKRRGGGFHRLAALRLILAILLLALSLPAFAAPTFPALTGRVVDEAGILPAATEVSLEQKLKGLEDATGDQLVIVTLKSLQGYEIADYGYQLGRFWQIGQKDKNNGVLLIVAPNERDVRIEVGYGLEGDLTDAVSRLIIEQSILPKFRAGDMAGGIVAGTDDILKVLSGDAAAYKEKAAQEPKTYQPKRPEDSSIIGIVPFLIIVFIIIVLANRGRRGMWWGGPMGGLGGGMGSGGWSSGSGGGWSGGGGFSGGGGSFGGGGASGRW